MAGVYDADDDGDLILDGADANTGASYGGLFSTLFLGMTQTVNANAGSTQAQIDPVISAANTFNLIFFFGSKPVGARTVQSANVNCFGLVYCRRGAGTAVLTGLTESSPTLPRGTPWTDYNPDGSGFPNLEAVQSSSGDTVLSAGVQPRVGTDQIAPGDTYNVTFGTDAGPISVPLSLAAYFVTTPALRSHSSGGATTAVSYPVAAGTPGSSGSAPIVMESNRLTLTFWRPQRTAIPGAEARELTDQGHLRYGVTPTVEGFNREFSCAGQYSALSPTLSAEASTGIFPEQGAQLFPLIDKADDAAPDPGETLSFTVDLGACLSAAGVTAAGRTMNLTLTAAGEPRPGGQDRGAQIIAVRLPG